MMTDMTEREILLLVEELLSFALKKKLLYPIDIFAARNQICWRLELTPDSELFFRTGLYDLQNAASPPDLFPVLPNCERDDGCETAFPIMKKILDYCADKGLIPENTNTCRDLMDAEIMGMLMPRESEVAAAFYRDYAESPEKASQNFYHLSRACNYIQVDRINKNMYWRSDTEYGRMEITINLSKPEKDPKEIAAARTKSQTGYPKCLLCVENVGFAGHSHHPARQNLRVIPMTLNGESWYFQYSPYVYYNEHCIVLNEKHAPMKINEAAFRKLFDFIRILPHYFVGSNADLPIVGGSILSHDHFQGGRHVFPMEEALPFLSCHHPEYPDIEVSLVKWPLSVIRISGPDTNDLIALAMLVLNEWREYSDEEADIWAYSRIESNKIPHNTITPIARKNKQGLWELDLVLRNNRTTMKYPLGIFHPHDDLHHIKKENIGLIEVMGLAVLPGRLGTELREIENYLAGDEKKPNPIHEPWVRQLVERYGRQNSPEEAGEIVKKEVGEVFKKVLLDAGIFKETEAGRRQYWRFMEQAGFRLNETGV